MLFVQEHKPAGPLQCNKKKRAAYYFSPNKDNNFRPKANDHYIIYICVLFAFCTESASDDQKFHRL